MDENTDEAFFATARTVLDSGRLREEARFVQHGATSTLLHSIAVAYLSDAAARAFGYDTHLEEVRRAGLLHDYYLYDWHDGDSAHWSHGFTHGTVALNNAREDYPDLTAIERDAIEHHMFPLVAPPRYGAGWIVSLIDKRCAAYETSLRSGRSYPRLRDMCARWLPDVDLGHEPLEWPSAPLLPNPIILSFIPVPAIVPAIVRRGVSLGGR